MQLAKTGLKFRTGTQASSLEDKAYFKEEGLIHAVILGIGYIIQGSCNQGWVSENKRKNKVENKSYVAIALFWATRQL